MLLTTIKSYADIIIGKSIKLHNKSADIDVQRQEAQEELATLRQEADKNSRMFKSLYESLVNGLITADEYRDMRADYETKTKNNLARAAEIEKRQAELDKQITEYFELAELIANADNSKTAALIDSLVDKIKIFSDRSIEIDFSFLDGFGLINEVTDYE